MLVCKILIIYLFFFFLFFCLINKKEPDRLLRFCNVLQNVLYLIYYPCEHIAWASSLSLVEADTLAWMYRSDWLWVFALIFALISYIHQYIVASKEGAKLKTVLKNAVKKDLDGKTSVASVIDQLSIARAKKNRTLLNILQDGSDFMNAVNWLPAGYLWAEKFPTYLVGVFGVISSVCGIYKAWPGK